MNDRKQVWITAWAATASAVTCLTPEAATKWADEALKAYDERFKQHDKKPTYIRVSLHHRLHPKGYERVSTRHTTYKD